MLTPEQLEKLRSTIEQRYESLSAEIHQDAARSREQSYGELAGSAPDSGDSGVADLISDLGNAELDRDLTELRQLDAARDRIAAGSYGTCVDCSGEIEFDRLQAQPAALRCFDCQRAHEKTYAHPAAPKL